MLGLRINGAHLVKALSTPYEMNLKDDPYIYDFFSNHGIISKGKNLLLKQHII